MKTIRLLSPSFLCIIVLLSLVTPTLLVVPQPKAQSPSTGNLMDQLPPGQKNMTFTSDITLNLTSGNTITFTTGNKITFTTGITFKFTPAPGNISYIENCFWGQVVDPVVPPNLTSCTWWELKDPNGIAMMFEFHVDKVVGKLFHVDQVWPGPFQLPPWPFAIAELKIDSIEPCDYFVVHEPPEWGPPKCTWWEVLYPHEWEGVEFHVDWSNESCEFHVDIVIGVVHPLVPWPYYVIAEQKISEIKPCDYFSVADPALVPGPCSWWEIIAPKGYSGYEFHVDSSFKNGTFHIDQVTPGNLTFLLPPPYQVIAEKKIDSIGSCTFLKVVENPSGITPMQCEWYEIIYPSNLKGYEFHIDGFNGTHIHIDTVIPQPITGIVTYQVAAERKITTINPCNNFKIIAPAGWHPDICSWWKIINPPEWRGVLFHIDSWNGMNNVFWFHMDKVNGPIPVPPTPPPWNVTAEPYIPPLYWKPSFPDYAPSGMPDFDERQMGTYNWTDKWGAWSHCASVAVANSLWWLDSEFETNTIPPPQVTDNFRLVSSYATMLPFWDDHDPQNVQPFVEHLAYLMDTDGRRTGLAHSGTVVAEIEYGLAQYLSWTGINPQGDVNGDGTVNQTDLNIVNAAFGSIPGSPNWNMAADIAPVTTGWPNRLLANNKIDMQDVNLVAANMNATGMFYERTLAAPTFKFIEDEVEKCEDVVLTLGFWQFTGGTWYREGDPIGHAVTVAGVNSTSFKIAISDPIWDAFENGIITQGHVPFPHVHMPPEPPYTTHNDAKLVSHDIYDVTSISPPLPIPCPGGNWTLVRYPGAPPGFMAVIENAVVTSPLGIHDVAVTNVTTSKDGCKPMLTVPDNSFVKVNVTVLNKGNFTETFNVTLYANLTVVDTKTVSGLTLGTQAVVNFRWNTTGWAHGNYTIKAYAVPVPSETNTGDNTFVNGVIKVVIPGDINGDGKVNILDAIILANAFLAKPSDPAWNPNSDLNGDNIINILDAIILANHFLEHE